jgi:hypothetical protein
LPLKLGHLTDIHVNVRQDALSRSRAQVIEGESGSIAGKEAVGGKVAHAFWAFKELIKKMAGKKKDVDAALLLTGDYIDFNRDINPWRLKHKMRIGEQWKQFNILANVESNLYLRGLNHTLVYSLVRNAYTEHKMPVFMVSGNHDAYQFPFGISPRVELFSWSFWLGAQELFGLSTKAHKQEREWASKWVEGKGDEYIPADHNLTIYEATLAYGPTYGQVMTSENFKAEQFDWFHMLFTPFSDAVLALGGEATGNGAGAQQILALLGWGGKENYKNLGDLRYFGGQQMGVDRQGEGILPRAVQSFGAGQKSLLKCAEELKDKNGCPVVLGSHFTMISYKLNMALNSKDVAFTPWHRAYGMPWQPAAFNEANEGTCERDQLWFYREMLQKGAVDWYISGHSHRAGVYQVDIEKIGFGNRQRTGICQVGEEEHPGGKEEAQVEVKVKLARDPCLSGGESCKITVSEETCPGAKTRFVVSGSGGLIGRWQNLEGELGTGSADRKLNLEKKLSGGLLRPPSGSWIDVKERTVEQVKADQKPRLCVILDYLAVMNPGEDIVPIRFARGSWEPFEKGIRFNISEEMAKWNCLNLEKMKIWLFQRKKTDEGNSGEWHKINRSIDKKSGILRLTEDLTPFFVEPPTNAEFQEIEDKAEWEDAKRRKAERKEAEKSARNSKGVMPSKYALQAFCEIPLNTPCVGDNDNRKPIAGGDDLNCDDPWIFPLEIGIMERNTEPYPFATKKPQTFYYFRRPFGEKGEVPDWWFRFEYFGDKGYITATKAIRPERAPKGTGGSQDPYPLE